MGLAQPNSPLLSLSLSLSPAVAWGDYQPGRCTAPHPRGASFQEEPASWAGQTPDPGHQAPVRHCYWEQSEISSTTHTHTHTHTHTGTEVSSQVSCSEDNHTKEDSAGKGSCHTSQWRHHRPLREVSLPGPEADCHPGRHCTAHG